MNEDEKNTYSFNNNDWEFIITIKNGINSIQLKPEAWDDLFLEEDIFQWFTKGTITIKSPFDTFERESDSAVQLLQTDKKNLVYKFRNDGRDTIYITILPKADSTQNQTYKENLWRIELECVIYDVEDFSHGNISNKMKRLYFWEKSYQMMLEKNIEFSTALVGENKNKSDVINLTNEERSLMSGEAIGELLFNDEDFSKFSNLYANGENWDMGDGNNKIFYTSPSNYKFIDDLNELTRMHTSDENNKFQPCLLRLERPEKKGVVRQFSLMSIKDYFKKAGKDANSPGEYQIEHLFLEEYQENPGQTDPITIKKAPIGEASLDKDVKAEDYTKLKNFQLVDFSGIDHSSFLQNRNMISFNGQKGQFNVEINEHKSEKYQEFAMENIYNSVLTNQKEERLPMTPYMKNGYNSISIYSPHPKENTRMAEGRNMLLKYYLFSNLGIVFTRRGMTIRQPGRFFGLSKQAQNDKEHDNKMEGQYFITNVIHHFSTSKRSYMNTITGVKTHTFEEMTKFEEDDLIQIK